MTSRMASRLRPDWLADGKEVGVAHAHPQGGVLGQVQVLVGKGGHGGAHRLGKDHQAESIPFWKAYGQGCLLLSLGHSEDCPPDHFGHEGGGVHGDPREEGGELGGQEEASLEAKGAVLCRVKPQGGTQPESKA